MKRSRGLAVGTSLLLALVLLCTLGPMILSPAPAADPIGGSLLPPGSRATEIVLANGNTMVSPSMEIGPDSVTIDGFHVSLSIDAGEIAAIREVRFWLGSDRFGRDLLRQLMAGGRLSVSIAALAALIALVIGSTVGFAAATGGRTTDMVIMRLVDALMAFPILFLLILVATLFRPGPLVMVGLLGLTSWMGLSRLVRGQVLSLRGRDFVLAARAAGSTPIRTWRTHFLPNLSGPLSQDTALRLGDLVLAEATLSYLGLGLPPDLPTWGGLVAQGHRVPVEGWWIATFAGLAIACLVISLALIGDGIQERLATGGS